MWSSRSTLRYAVPAPLLFILILFLLRNQDAPAAEAANATSADLRSLEIPLFFEEFETADGPPTYVARRNGFTLALTSAGGDLYFANEETGSTSVSLRFDGAEEPLQPNGESVLPSTSDYFVGDDRSQWKTGVRHVARVRYPSVYPGIDVSFYGNPHQLEFDFEVAPGADPSQIVMSLEGADATILEDTGDILIAHSSADITIKHPNIYQQVDGNRLAVAGAFREVGPGRFRIDVGTYDDSMALTIDPIVLVSGSYLGGVSGDASYAVTTDSDGDIYVMGTTGDGAWIAANPQMPFVAGGLFILQLTPDAKQLLWNGFITSDDWERGYDIKVDGQGYIYIAGYVEKPEPRGPITFPWTGFIGSGGKINAFAAKINPAASSIVYTVMIAGSRNYVNGWGSATNRAYGITVDSEGNAYVAGVTDSWDFPTTDGAFIRDACYYEEVSGADCDSYWHRDQDWDDDGWVAKLSPSGAPLYVTLMGTIAKDRTVVTTTSLYTDDAVTDIEVDPSGRAYITGYTDGDCDTPAWSSHFPTTPGAYRNCGPDLRDQAFVAVLEADGSALAHSSLFGGDGNDYGEALAFGTDDVLWVAGETNSTDLPTTPGVFMDQLATPGDECIAYIRQDGTIVYDPCGDAFLVEYATDLSGLGLVTYIGGNTADLVTTTTRRVGEEVVNRVVTDRDGNVYLAGTTEAELFPVHEAYQDAMRGETDGWLAMFDKDGAAQWVTFLGGLEDDYLNGLAVNEAGNVIVSGISYALEDNTDPNFPTKNPLQQGYGGGAADAFIAVLGDTWEMDPEGVVYDPENYDLHQGEAQSTYTDMIIRGPNLQDASDVVFQIQDGTWKDDPYMVVSDVVPTIDEVRFKLEVVHQALLGERKVRLKRTNGPDIDVSAATGKRFLVSRGSITFNQAVADRSLDSDGYNRIQIARKPGVYRFQFDDEDRYGESYFGNLYVKDRPGNVQSAERYTYQPSYSDQDILDGKDYLTIKWTMPDDSEPGERAFYAELVSAPWKLRTPDIKRDFKHTERIGIVVRRYTVDLPNGTTLRPTFDDLDAQDSFLFTEKVFPISHDQFDVTYLGTRSIPTDVAALVDLTTDRFTQAGQDLFFKKLGQALRNRRKLQAEDTLDHIVVGILPPEMLTHPVVPTVVGVASLVECVTFISDDRLDRLGSVIAHEIGHLLESCLQRKIPALELLQDNPTYDLGDEYENGYFNCEVNPPINTLTGSKHIADPSHTEKVQCSNSLLYDGVHGDKNGTWVTSSGFDAVHVIPRLRYQSSSGGPSQDMHNIMSAAHGDDETWISPLAYDALHRVFLPDVDPAGKMAPRLLAAGPALEIMGVVLADGTAQITGVESVVVPLDDTPNVNATYSIELLDDNGAATIEHPLEVSFLELTNPPVVRDRAPFRITIPQQGNPVSVQLNKGETPVAIKALSKNAPLVTITSPAAGSQLSGVVDLTWRATDADNDPLSYSVLVSEDGGETYIPIDELLSDTHYRLDTSSLGTTGDLTVVVLASDGYNTGQASIGATLNTDPVISSVSPSQIERGLVDQHLSITGQRFQQGASVSISGQGISVDSVAFTSQSALEIWVDVSPTAETGPRDITVSNPDGTSATLYGLLQVVEPATMDVMLSWSPPDSLVLNGPPRNLTASISSANTGAKPAGFVRLPLTGQRNVAIESVYRNLIANSDTTKEVEPNNLIDFPQILTGPSPILVTGQLEPEDLGQLLVTYQTGEEDDVEDLFSVTLTEPGFSAELSGFTSDCQLYVMTPDPLAIVGFAVTESDTAAEVVELPELEAGTYLIGVSLVDWSDGVAETPYVLHVEGAIGPQEPTNDLTAYRVYRSTTPSAAETGVLATEIPLSEDILNPENWTDEDVAVGDYYYAVTAMYGALESEPSNEVFVEGQTSENRSPILSAPLSDVQLLVGTEPYALNLLAHFTDLDGDILTFEASSSSQAVAGVTISGHMAHVEAVGIGEATITLSASDGHGGRTQAIFTVTIPTGVGVDASGSRFAHTIGPNYPNPFIGHTVIPFELAEPAVVVVEVYDMLGRKVATLLEAPRGAGSYRVGWDARASTGQKAPAGLYFVRMQAGSFEATRTIILHP